MNLYRKAVELAESGRPFALATVVKASGSTPQKAGAAALFEPAGTIWGTLGGGCLEAESRVRALRALDEAKPTAFDLSLDEDYGWDDGLICGGRVRILVDPRPAQHREAWSAALDALDRGERGWLVTMARDDAVNTYWLPETVMPGLEDIPSMAVLFALVSAEELQDSLQTGRFIYRRVEPDLCPSEAQDGVRELAGLERAVGMEISVEPVTPAPRLLIAGGGHIGQALAKLGDFLGFEVTVVDDRPGFTDARLYPEGVRTVCDDIARTVASFPIGTDTYVVIVTRGHRHDGEVLERCIHAPSAYLGMIGSKRKILLIRKQFLERGVATAEEMDRVHSPMGLDIGSVTVPEIAMSIAAELVAVRRRPQHTGRPLREAVPAPRESSRA